MLKLLVLFTSNYPNSSGEVFVENEIRVLEKYFDKILIICAAEKAFGVTRYIPENAEVFVFNEDISMWQKLKSIRFLFSKLFWQEIYYCRKSLKLKFSLTHIKILLVDLIKGYLLRGHAKRIIKNHDSIFDIFLYSYWSDYKAVACAFMKKGNSEYKAFTRNHRWDLYFYTNKPQYLPLRKFIFAQLNAIYCIANDGVNYLKNELKFSNNNFYVSKLGTYNHFVLNNYDELDTLKIVSCSNLIPVKRVNLIFDALSLIHDIKIKWIHFGDGLLMNNLLAHSEKLKSKKNFQFDFKGQTSNQEILKFYSENQIDLLVNVSESEGIPVSIMEAISFGIPVIATSVGGTPEIVKDGFNGYLLPQDTNPQEIADVIKKYYSLPLLKKKQMRENAFKIWDQEYNAEKNYNGFIEEILKL